MDSQLVEVLGRNCLVAELARAGIEAALPVRDRGVDLVAYNERGEGVSRFAAVPIQLKAATERAFSLDAKYAAVPGLLLAYVWGVGSPGQEVTFVLTYAEALAVADAMGWTATPSWRAGYYTNTSPGAKLQALLAPYRASRERWHQLLAGAPAPAA